MEQSLKIDDKLSRVNNKAIFRRYLDLPKFVELLRTNSIYLARTDLMSDKFEGSLTPIIYRGINEAHSQSRIDYSADEFIKKSKKNTYISCWSMSAIDNMALWHLYSNISTGIAITTTKEKLIQECLHSVDNENIEIFKVQYINHFNNPDMIIGSYTDSLRFKHKAYSYEREVRIVINRTNHNASNKEQPEGIKVRVNINNLIRSVVVSPEAGTWFHEQVHDLVKRYQLNAHVRKSKLTYLPK